MNLELLILEGPQAGRRMPIHSGATTFGRSANAEVSFPWDNFISGTHLSVQADPVGVLITDLHSTNGTFLNGQRINKAVANVGDTIKIGSMTMQVVLAPQQANEPVFSASTRPAEPASAHRDGPASGATTTIPVFALPPMSIPAPPAAGVPEASRTLMQDFGLPAEPVTTPGRSAVETKTPEGEALRILRELPAPLFCLLNAGEDETLPAMLLHSGRNLPEHSLLESSGGPLPQWAPFLLPLSGDTELLSTLVRNGWGKAWACFFTSSAPFAELRLHFGKFLSVQVANGGEVYFRFYDPRVLRSFLPVASENERRVFFGSVTEWLLEGEDRDVMLRAHNAAEGISIGRVRLT